MAKKRNNVRHNGIVIPETYDPIRNLVITFNRDREAVKVVATMDSFASVDNVEANEGPFDVIHISKGVHIAGTYFLIEKEGEYFNLETLSFDNVGTKFADEETALRHAKKHDLDYDELLEQTYSDPAFVSIIDQLRSYVYINIVTPDARYIDATDDETLTAP